LTNKLQRDTRQPGQHVKLCGATVQHVGQGVLELVLVSLSF
jgi:hypothetical protein